MSSVTTYRILSIEGASIDSFRSATEPPAASIHRPSSEPFTTRTSTGLSSNCSDSSLPSGTFEIDCTSTPVAVQRNPRDDRACCPVSRMRRTASILNLAMLGLPTLSLAVKISVKISVKIFVKISVWLSVWLSFPSGFLSPSRP